MTEDSPSPMSAQEANRRLVELCRRVAREKDELKRDWDTDDSEEHLEEMRAGVSAMRKAMGLSAEGDAFAISVRERIARAHASKDAIQG